MPKIQKWSDTLSNLTVNNLDQIINLEYARFGALDIKVLKCHVYLKTVNTEETRREMNKNMKI